MRKLNIQLDQYSKGVKHFQTGIFPYKNLSATKHEFTSNQLFGGEVVEDSIGNYYRILNVGGGWFGGPDDKCSTQAIEVRRLKRRTENKAKFVISISTKNPKLTYGGVWWDGWFDTIEDCIRNYPKEYRNKSAGEAYWTKVCKIIHLSITNLETGEIKKPIVLSKYNKLLNSLR